MHNFDQNILPLFSFVLLYAFSRMQLTLFLTNAMNKIPSLVFLVVGMVANIEVSGNRQLVHDSVPPTVVESCDMMQLALHGRL